MGTLASVCGAILVLLLAWATLLAGGLPMHTAIALSLFGGCVVGLLLMAIRLSVLEGTRGHHAGEAPVTPDGSGRPMPRPAVTIPHSPSRD